MSFLLLPLALLISTIIFWGNKGEFPALDVQLPSAGSDFFSDLDNDIQRVSKQLFNDGHYADSVSAAFRELNHQVKQEYKRRKNVELDGADLMHKAYSPRNPVTDNQQPQKIS
jgi:uncharacterized protein Ymh